MPFSSFRVSFPEDDRVIHRYYAKDTFIRALEHIGLDKLEKLRIKGCKSRITVNSRSWFGSRKTVKSTRTYCIVVGISNRQKKRYLDKVCEELDVNINVEL